MDRIVALIPARAGSKGVPGKNIKALGGAPLLAWAITAAKNCPLVDRVVVTTDSAEIQELAQAWGAEAPFLRPTDLAQDASPDRAYVMHALDFFKNEAREPAYIALFRPTTPVRDPEVVNAALQAILENEAASGLRTIHPLPEPPQKMMGLENGWLTGLFPQDPRPEYYNLPRQSFPTAYQPNGYVDILTANTLRSSTSGIFGNRVMGFPTEVVVEVDTPETFELLEFQVARRRPKLLDLLLAKS